MANPNVPAAAKPAAATPLQRFNNYLLNPRVQQYLDSVLYDNKAAFVNNLVAIVSSDAKLQACEPSSILNAAYKATALKLPFDPNLGMAYVIPYKDNRSGKSVATFQMGYKGYIQLALRTGMVKTVNVTDVRQGEIARRDRLTGEIEFSFIENDAERLKAPVIGYACYYEMVPVGDAEKGYTKILYMSREECEDHALKYSQTYKSSNPGVKKSSKWATDFDAMAKKTVVKQLLSKWGSIEIEKAKPTKESAMLMDAIRSDQAAINDDGSPDYVDGVDDQSRMAEEVEQQKAAMRQAKAGDDLPEDYDPDLQVEPKDGLF